MVRPPVRLFLAALSGVALTLLLNRVGVWWLGANDFSSDAFYDVCAAFLTLTLPAFLAGLAVGFVAREQGLNVAALTFALFCAAGFVRPFWRIPPSRPKRPIPAECTTFFTTRSSPSPSPPWAPGWPRSSQRANGH